MAASILNSLQSELIKTKRSAALWLVVLSAFFMPGIVLLMRLLSVETTYNENTSGHLWGMIYSRNWGAMGMFLLPLAIILFASMVTNMEYKNNTWKQLHTSPQKFTTIFFAKFVVIFILLLQLFILFNIGIYLSAVLPSFVFRGIVYPTDPYPFYKYLMGNLKFFVDCLPIIALQYLFGLQFKNFLVSIAAGFALLVASLLALNWKYGYVIPYIYSPLNFDENKGKVDPSINIHTWAIIYFLLIMIVSYILYIRKKEKG